MTFLNDYLLMITKRQEVYNQLLKIRNAGGEVYLVGGLIRDVVLGEIPKEPDLDFEVFNLSMEKLQEILGVEPVAKNYHVFFVTTKNFGQIQFTIPRKENSTGVNYNQVKFEVVPSMSVKEAAKRRDLTFNAMYWHCFNYELIDPFNGLYDLVNGYARVIDKETFKQSIERVLRVARFIGQYGFLPVGDTAIICREMSKDSKLITPELHEEQFYKILTRSRYLGNALKFLKDSQWYNMWHPEIDRAFLNEMSEYAYENKNAVSIEMYLAAMFFAEPAQFERFIQVINPNCKNSVLKRTKEFIRLWEYVDSMGVKESTMRWVHYNLQHCSYKEHITMLYLAGIDLNGFEFYEFETNLISGYDVREIYQVEGVKVGLIIKILRDAHIFGMFYNRESMIAFMRNHTKTYNL